MASYPDEEPPPGVPAPEILRDRIWIDGCFDFFHHGHAGAIVQARQLGRELYVGVHCDEAIMENKGPTVMTLDERLAAVDACRWTTRSVPHAPYVTQLSWITHFGCLYVVHGDDITSDSSGEDCYRFVKAADRFRVVRRTPSISTTDLVGRMLLCTRSHFIRSLAAVLAGQEGGGDEDERKSSGLAMRDRIKLYATDETGLAPGCDVCLWEGNATRRRSTNATDAMESTDATDTTNGTNAMRATTGSQGGVFEWLVRGVRHRQGQRVVYVDGGFDLFSSGHIEFLKLVVETEQEIARKQGFYAPDALREREANGGDYPPAFVVAGVHDDATINQRKGINYPIMNIFERGLCVLQCKYVNAVVFATPLTPSSAFLSSLPWGVPQAVYHGPTSFMKASADSADRDPYVDARAMGIFRNVGSHAFQEVNAGSIVDRIMKSRDMYEQRQKAKGVKAGVEEAARRREVLEEEQREKEKEWMGRG